MLEMQSTRPSMLEDARSYLGLNYSPPVGLEDNLAEISKIPGDIRNGVDKIMSLSDI